MLVSNSYDSLSKVLGALRAHDTETIEALADPRAAERLTPGGRHGPSSGGSSSLTSSMFRAVRSSGMPAMLAQKMRCSTGSPSVVSLIWAAASAG